MTLKCMLIVLCTITFIYDHISAPWIHYTHSFAAGLVWPLKHLLAIALLVMRMGLAPLYPKIISQKGQWLEEFSEVLEDLAATVPSLTLFITFFYPALHIMFITRPVKSGLDLIKRFLSIKMIQIVVYFSKYHSSEAWRHSSLNVSRLSSGVFIFLTEEAISNKASMEPLRTVTWKGALFDMVFKVSQMWVVLLCFSKGIRVS